MSRRSSSIPSDNNQRLEPKLLRAAENNDTKGLEAIIQEARSNGQMSENFLRIGLMRSAEQGRIAATQYLLREGARTDVVAANRSSPLLRAVERNHVGIVQLLLDHGASTETADKKGRTALMTAAWRNHWHILQLLLSRGANVHAKDSKKRNILHNLAADKQCDWGDDVLGLLLTLDICIDGREAQDDLGRSPLHWACATGKKHFAEKLLSRPGRPGANVNANERKSKTSLHIAAAHDRDDLVELLLTYDADVNAKSDGGWTPLHNACDKGAEKIVPMLLQAGAEINSKLLNGTTALHLAAQGGHVAVVKCLLQCKDVKLTTRDTFGSTPLLRAAQFRRKDIVQLLAPYNHVGALSEDALGACNGFDATIVDFGNYHNENQVKRRTVYELLYGRDPKDSTKHAISTLPGNVKATRFRWIHLPANNMVWVEALLTKIFIEEGASDLEGFKALEKSFSHQHRGQRIHSHFMRPLSQSTPRAPRQDEDEETELVTPSIVVNGATKEDKVPETPVRISKSSSNQKNHVNGSHHETKGKRMVKRGTDAPKSEQDRKSSLQLANSVVKSPGSPSKKDTTHSAKSNIYTFMPYLHFESDLRRQEMQEAIRHAETLQARPTLKKARTYDEMLLRAHLGASNTSLHVRRTLDQFFYHNIDTQSRDCDQVVFRYQTKGRGREDAGIDAKIFMVDQLWMWTLGKDLVVTSFPQRWQQPKNDPLNVLDNIIEDINSKTREPVKSVYDLAMIITGRCCGAFDRHRMGDEDYQFLDMFESSIGSATDRETTLFNEFNDASVQASDWLKHHRRPNRFSRKLESSAETEDKFKFEDHNRRPLFVDKLLDIGQEIKLLTEIKDIRDELNMIRMVLQYQLQVLPDLQEAICDIYKEEHRSHQEVKKRIKDQQKIVDVHIKDLDRMDRQAERIYDSITDLLDLKQKHANAFEARFARDQAAGTARQGQTIMVFTIVTIIFLPLSFIAACFAINIQEFPRNVDGSQKLPVSYVARYMFGIGFAISIPLVLIALSLDDVGDLYREAIRRLRRKRSDGERHPPPVDDVGRAAGFLKMEQASSVARSAGGSVRTSWVGSLLPVARRTTGESERSRRRFMFRNSLNIERRDGLHPC